MTLWKLKQKGVLWFAVWQEADGTSLVKAKCRSGIYQIKTSEPLYIIEEFLEMTAITVVTKQEFIKLA